MVHHSKQSSEHLLCKNTQENVAQTRAQGRGAMTEGLDKGVQATSSQLADKLVILHNGAGEPLMVECFLILHPFTFPGRPVFDTLDSQIPQIP